jgi:hypothetical protein
LSPFSSFELFDACAPFRSSPFEQVEMSVVDVVEGTVVGTIVVVVFGVL